MKLVEFLKSTGRANAEFAAIIGVSRQALDRYLKGRVPEPDTMRRIVAETNGRVTPNDFYAADPAASPHPETERVG